MCIFNLMVPNTIHAYIIYIPLGMLRMCRSLRKAQNQSYSSNPAEIGMQSCRFWADRWTRHCIGAYWHHKIASASTEKHNVHTFDFNLNIMVYKNCMYMWAIWLTYRGLFAFTSSIGHKTILTTTTGGAYGRANFRLIWKTRAALVGGWCIALCYK